MDLSQADITSIRETAELMADAARRVTLQYFRGGELATENKWDEGFDPVTVADREAEKSMRAILAEKRPEDSILGEEFGGTVGTSGLTWVLDPIDGTRGFISGTPTWGVLIAVSDENGPIFGVIDQPYIGERFRGGFGLAEMQGPHWARGLGVSSVSRLSDATLFTTFPEVGTFEEAAAFREVEREVKLTRYGMDCYAYALLAAGQVDLVIEAGLQSYDIQAPIAVIQAAGGVVTDWKGEPAHNGGRVLAAATPELHAAALLLLSDA
ncbi:histidinol-phosphatase [Halocynthiibacter sp. C4]|uniref:histidinol-phosphatase n=2 Tax=Halocynthiibacter sp. C4 TaxID=2992758 RepID=UPI00237B160E|nr:histidinol-phosphatase [Halocynthiibacter sp. C4]MDE0590220.1 histidinol-phosphatase [Halocynthiibacter sp. C4]